jgi:hypothetical protein
MAAGLRAGDRSRPAGTLQHDRLRHPETASVQPEFLVDIAPHDVFYDPDRQLWYCDIEVTWGASYYPFIRLALARYQPTSVPGAHLSKVVLADFMPLVSDRWLNVSQTQEARTRRVAVFGSTYGDSSAHVEAERCNCYASASLTSC